MTSLNNPLRSFLDAQGFVMLDGGLATELEARGENLDDDLWSARLLMENPDLILQVHLDYLYSGADCIVTSSYQATLPGFRKRGLSEREARDLLHLSVRLAFQARDRFWADPNRPSGRLRPLVAASIGPYGAFRSDGSEYTGRYDLDQRGLESFHQPRWQILAGSGADLLACETIPSRAEGRALCRLLLNTPEVPAWFSFSCRDGKHLSDGSRFDETLAEIAEAPQAVALGINCTAPRFIPDLLDAARKVTDKPLVAYPNSGEKFDARRKRWSEQQPAIDLGQSCRDWHAAGARLIGGCCRTRPRDIRQIREALSK